MSTRTIKAFDEKQKQQAEKDRPALFLGCTCPKCDTTWIVCEMPQGMAKLATITARHRFCPHCKGDDITIATPAQIRPLLAG